MRRVLLLSALVIGCEADPKNGAEAVSPAVLSDSADASKLPEQASERAGEAVEGKPVEGSPAVADKAPISSTPTDQIIENEKPEPVKNGPLPLPPKESETPKPYVTGVQNCFQDERISDFGSERYSIDTEFFSDNSVSSEIYYSKKGGQKPYIDRKTYLGSIDSSGVAIVQIPVKNEHLATWEAVSPSLSYFYKVMIPVKSVENPTIFAGASMHTEGMKIQFSSNFVCRYRKVAD